MYAPDADDVGPGWEFVPADRLGRRTEDVLIEAEVRDALMRLNPEIAARPELADQVLYRLRAIVLSVQSDGLVAANERFTAWLRGEQSMPFGRDNQHVPVRLLDFDDMRRNRCVVTRQVTFRSGQERRFDVVLYVNGVPLVVGEAKTPVRPAVTWVDGAAQIQDDYEVNVPAFFVPNVFSFSTEGKTYRYGSIRMPLELWAPWRAGEEGLEAAGLAEVRRAVRAMLRPSVVLDILRHFCIFGTDKRHRKIKIIPRYQQYEAANQIVQRVVEGRVKKGLIWHFQGSGKSLLMVFAAQKLRVDPELRAPTVLIVVDRIDLNTQITATFNMADVPNTVTTESRAELMRLLAGDARRVIITTIHKFAEAGGVLNRRENIIVMVDEAHRTQEGSLGDAMRDALPNAFFFGLTGTPINTRDRNTFRTFGAAEDERVYMSRYSFEESIRDGATLPLHFEPRQVGRMRIDRAAVDEAFAALTETLTEEDQADLSKRAARLGVLVKAPERVRAVVEDIARHYQEVVEPNGFKAQVVAFDREACVLYKDALDLLMSPESSEVVMSVGQGDPAMWRTRFGRPAADEERLLDRFRDPRDPLKILIVTSRLLTGFDAPILQAMYLDKPMKDHTLLQAICRTNRPFPKKDHGLIVDYLGVFDDVAQSLNFDEQAIRAVIGNLDQLRAEVPGAVAACLAFFPGVDRSVGGYEGLIAAQECLPTNERRDEFAMAYSVLSRLWEALSPDPCLRPYREDYRWLTHVYESVQSVSGTGRLLWHALGAKTIELIHENVHIEATSDQLETLVLDAGVLEELVERADPRTAQEIEIRIVARLRRHQNNPVFVALGERLERLRERHERGLLNSIEFLKLLLELARDVVYAEREADPVEVQDQGKAALTELFLEVRTPETPVMVERIVGDIDEIVRIVRFPGWQHTVSGEREVQRALRRTLLKYALHREQELFDRAYGYIKQYY
ncbi:MAG: type I restriction endonuclease subunit R [Dehalococcoidia bacterium]